MRILHLSDIHLDKDLLPDSQRLLRRLSEKLSEIQNDKPIDFIVISGDLVDVGGKSFGSIEDGFKCFESEFVQPILKLTGLPRERVMICPGNHDSDGSKVTAEDEKEIRLNSVGDVNYFISKQIRKNTKAGVYSLERIRSYNDYNLTFGASTLPDGSRLCTALSNHYKFRIGDRVVGFSCLNTIWRCNEKGEGKPFILGILQINEASDFLRDCDYTIAIMHNPPSALADWEQSDVKMLIHQNYDLLLYGHSHIGDSDVRESESGAVTYLCAAGTIQANAGNTQTYGNGFSIIDVGLEDNSIEHRKYIQKADENYALDTNHGDDGVWKPNVSHIHKFFNVKVSLLQQKEHNYPIIRNGLLDSIIQGVRNTDSGDIQIYGLSGLGKTRIVYEAFNNGVNSETLNRTYYCLQADGGIQFKDELETLLYQTRDGKATIIADNCSDNVFGYIQRRRNSMNPSCRIIALTSNVFDSPKGEHKQFVIRPSDLEGMVSEYVNSQIPEAGDGLTLRETIKRFSEGFPMIAIKLVLAVKSGEEINIHHTDSIIERLLDIDINDGSDESEYLKVMSLFQPFPVSEEAFKAIFSSDCFSRLNKLTPNELLRLRKRVDKKYGGSLIEITGGGSTIRPFPLAINIAGKWFEDNDDPVIFKGLIDYVNNLPDPPKKLIVECMAKRLERMNESAAAMDLVARLNNVNGVFRDENVVRSELGSRLILAMSTVNPLAVSNALYYVFEGKSPQWIKSNLSAVSRNNILWALRKLIIDSESFPNVMNVLGKLAIEETEDNIGNNSLSTFRDSFHIFLSGSQASLSQKYDFIRNISDERNVLFALTPVAIEGALALGSFMRIGGNIYGTKTIKDNVPTYAETFDYWDKCVQLTNSLISKGRFLAEIGNIIKNNLLRWSAKGVADRFLPLLEVYGRINGYSIGIKERDWHNFMSNVKRTSKPDVMEKCESIHHLYVKDNFMSELAAATQNFHENCRFSAPDFSGLSRAYFKPLAQRFIDLKIYENMDEIASILTENEGISMYFAPVLAEVLSEGQLHKLLDNIKSLIRIDDRYGYNPFLASLVPNLVNKKSFMDFLQAILDDGGFELYTQLMARSEDERLSHFYILATRFEGDSHFNFIPIYLSHANIYLSSYPILFRELVSRYDRHPFDIMEFVMRHSRIADKGTIDYAAIQELILSFPIKEALPLLQYEFWSFVTDMLEEINDSVFAKQLCHQILGYFNEVEHSEHLDMVFDILLKKHTNEVWPEFSEHFFSDDVRVFLMLKNHIGSGFSFGKGLLFQIDEQYLNEALKKYPETAPRRLAETCPVFDYESFPKGFSSWVLRLLDEYGDRKEVIGGLDANMNTFQWTGSIIPLLEDKVSALTPLLTHHHESVREWSRLSIESLKKEIEIQRNNEDFERIHYS